ncbi:MAG TPA: Ada metal-binding domain-containing protein [Candidatus Paceibacterota bacterium]|nr:Ada metal-binding domain-containing protein [Candidatus Paceibacterota bacterium]
MNGVTIQDFWLRCKAALDEGIEQWGLILLLFSVALCAFGLVRLSALEVETPPFSITQTPSATNVLTLSPGGYVVASRTGSVYYLPWCSGAQKIVQGNQVWFSSEEAAQKAGYTPSKSCKGL